MSVQLTIIAINDEDQPHVMNSVFAPAAVHDSVCTFGPCLDLLFLNVYSPFYQVCHAMYFGDTCSCTQFGPRLDLLLAERRMGLMGRGEVEGGPKWCSRQVMAVISVTLMNCVNRYMLSEARSGSAKSSLAL